MKPAAKPDSLLVIIPAFNEEGAVGHVVESVRHELPEVPVLVIDDYSSDNTIAVARAAGADILPLPHHLGLGGCVQAGYKLAYEMGFEYVIRVDGDGQHNACDVPRILERLKKTGCEMVIGSRIETQEWKQHWLRSVGVRFFRLLLRPILGKDVHDPTSGFVGVNRRALAVFRHSFPLQYPEIEALVVLQRRRFRFEEVPCKMRERMAGRSTINGMKPLYYMIHVMLGVLVNVLRYERRFHAAPAETAGETAGSHQSRDREGAVPSTPQGD